MQKNQQFLLAVLREVLGTEQIDSQDLNRINMEQFYQLAGRQGLSTIVYPVIYKHPVRVIADKDLSQAWNRLVWGISVGNITFLKQIYSLTTLLEQENIQAVLLKGIAIARLYKNPEIRGMGDIDILIDSSDWNRAKECLVQMGYVQSEEDDYNPLHIGFQKKGFIAVELHRNLIHTGYLGSRKSNDWYAHIWGHRKTITFKGLPFCVLAEEDELINQVTHFASHFIYFGTKLKHIFEIALIIRSFEESLDWEYIERTLGTLGFLKFGKLLFSVCKTFFYVEVPERMSDMGKGMQKRFLRDLIHYYSFEEKKDDFKGWLHVVGSYRSILDHPVKQPLAWAIEVRTQYKTHGFRPLFIVRNSFRNIRVMNRKLHLIRKFSLTCGDLISLPAKFLKLPAREKGLLFEAFLLMGITRLAILIFPFKKVASLMGQRMGESPREVSREMQAEIMKIGWTILRTSKFTPWESKCLVQALTGLLMLKYRRIPSTLYLGIAKDGKGKPIAHAWLRSGEIVVTGAAAPYDFKAVAQFATIPRHQQVREIGEINLQKK